MIMTDPYHPLFPVDTEYPLYIPAYNGCSMVFINDSSLNCIINFSNGQNAYMPANDRRLFQFNGVMAQPNYNILVVAQQLVTPTNTANRFVMEVYQPGECIREYYPMPLIRGINLVPSN